VPQEQEDAQEFLLFLLDHAGEELLKLKKVGREGGAGGLSPVHCKDLRWPVSSPLTSKHSDRSAACLLLLHW
jgi:hypothetical protein